MKVKVSSIISSLTPSKYMCVFWELASRSHHFTKMCLDTMNFSNIIKINKDKHCARMGSNPLFVIMLDQFISKKNVINYVSRNVLYIFGFVLDETIYVGWECMYGIWIRIWIYRLSPRLVFSICFTLRKYGGLGPIYLGLFLPYLESWFIWDPSYFRGVRVGI